MTMSINLPLTCASPCGLCVWMDTKDIVHACRRAKGRATYSDNRYGYGYS